MNRSRAKPVSSPNLLHKVVHQGVASLLLPTEAINQEHDLPTSPTNAAYATIDIETPAPSIGAPTSAV